MSRKILTLFFIGVSLLTLLSLFCFFAFVFYKGLGAFNLNLVFDDLSLYEILFEKKRVFDGIFNAIVGSLFVSVLAVCFALPLGFLSGIFIARFASKKVKAALSLSYELLASVPSIVIGLFGLSITIYLHKNFLDRLFPSLLISALSLAVLIMPYIVKVTEEALDNIPRSIRFNALNLGATKYQNLMFVEIIYILKYIFSGAVLSIGRAVEDTAVIMMTGAVMMAGVPSSLLQKYEALPFYIYYISSEYQNMNELNRGFAAAITLLLVSLCLFLIAYFLRRIITKRSGFNEQ